MSAGLKKHSIYMTLLVLLLVVLFLLSSCGERIQSYAVMLWPQEESAIVPATLVGIRSTSQLNNTHILFPVDQGSSASEEYEQWRVQVFDSEQEAKAFIEEMLPFAEDFAWAGRNALPVRAAPSSINVPRVYALRSEEMVKVISRTEEPEDVGGLQDYWYKVITEDGTQGWVFGYALLFEDPSQAQTAVSVSGDESLDRILNTVWRPEYFKWMIRDNVFDLTQFQRKMGFFPNPEKKQFVLILPRDEQIFNYDEIYRARAGLYVAEGSTLQISLLNENLLSVQFTVNNDTRSYSFVSIEEDVESVLNTELARRQAKLEEFVSRGKTLRSSHYGSITIGSNGSANWQQINRLQSIIPDNPFPGSGTVSFELYITTSLQSNYDGVISFLGESPDVLDGLNFFYSFTNGGLQLEYIPETSIRRNIVTARALTPVTLFFSYQ